MDWKRLVTSYTFWGATLTAVAASLPFVEKIAAGQAQVLSSLPELGTIWGLWLTASGVRNALYKIESSSASSTVGDSK